MLTRPQVQLSECSELAQLARDLREPPSHGLPTNVLVIFGTRPEAIKLAPVLRAFRERKVKTSVCITGQHREMLKPILSFFEIEPDFELNVMHKGQSLAQLTGLILSGVSDVLLRMRPSLVLVHGDTTTTLAASLASYYQKVPVAHVEAGLRTGNKYAPFPEEINRKLTGSLADFHFAPTEAARANLLSEGVDSARVWVTGNTAIDALTYTHNIVRSDSDHYQEVLHKAVGPIGNGRPVVLITAHRRENFGCGFEQICDSILQLARSHTSVDFVYPVHMNPHVRGPVEAILAPVAGGELKNLYLTDPLDYPTFIYLMGISRVILTDSGGIQEEAPSLGKPVVVMRDTTERPEGVAAGTSILVGADTRGIIDGVTALLSAPVVEQVRRQNPYGDGCAAERIAEVVEVVIAQQGARE